MWWGRAALPGGSRKRRPFLIVSNDAFNENESYPKVLVVHLPSVARSRGSYAWEVDLPKRVANLPVASVAKCGEVYILLKESLAEVVGMLPREHLERVDRALAVALDLSVRGRSDS